MPTTTYDDHGLSRRMMAFPQEWQETSHDTMEEVLLHIQGSVPAYPEPSKRAQPFKSDKSRRWFFANLKDGNLTVPYRRGGELGRTLGVNMSGGASGKSQLHEITHPSGYVQGRFGTHLNYAEMVIGKGDKQARYFRGVWFTVDDIIEASRAGVIELIDEMAKALGEWLEGK